MGINKRQVTQTRASGGQQVRHSQYNTVGLTILRFHTNVLSKHVHYHNKRKYDRFWSFDLRPLLLRPLEPRVGRAINFQGKKL
jgi:hypothetical protein